MRRIGPGFFAQNKRVVVLGGLGLTLGVFGFTGLLFSGITTLFKSSWPYTTGVQRAVSDPRVQAALGTPVVPGWMVTGSMKGNTARLNVPLEGPAKTGTLRIDARSQDAWQFKTLVVEIDSAPSIDLLAP